jgi:hypothetical protein
VERCLPNLVNSKARFAELPGEVTELKQIVAGQRDEIARLKGRNGRPSIKPSGMENSTGPKRGGKRVKRRRRGRVTPLVVPETEVLRVEHPKGSQFKGYESFRPRVWCVPTRAPAWSRCCQAIEVSISERQVMRLLIDGQDDDFLVETREVLRAGLATAGWITVDDTGARHRCTNGVCTQIGNDNFPWFGTTGSKSRQNFLDLLRAGHTDYTINDAALDYMREHAPAGTLVQRLATHRRRQFADEKAWMRHLERLGITDLPVKPDPVHVATEAALWRR